MKGVSEITGWLLMFAIITLSATVVFTVSYPYISDRIEESRIKIAEIQMTLLDYVSSKSSLGESPSQDINFNLLGGTLTFESGGNRFQIIGVFNEGEKEIYNSSIGRAVFRIGDVIIGYEGGGVWEKRDNTTIMLSPPEFHYRIDTLTYPIIKIGSNFSVSGNGMVTLNVKRGGFHIIYPNETRDKKFINPLKCNYILVKIKSDFWDGWKKYFEERSDARVRNIDEKNKTVTFILAVKSAPISRAYEMPIKITRLNYTNETPILEFTITFAGLHPNYELVFGSDTDPALIIDLKKRSGGGNDEFILRILYGNETKYESWVTEGRLKWNPDGRYTMDFLNKSLIMVYEPVGADVPPFNWPNSNFASKSWTWGNDHTKYDAGDFSRGDNETLYRVIEHYFAVLAEQTSPDITLEEFRAQGFNKQLSSYTLLIDQMPPIITYLHIVEHVIKIY